MRYFILLFSFFIFSGCAEEKTAPEISPFAHVQNEEVKNILEKAVAAVGGWEGFQNMDSIVYDKRTVLFDSLENVEMDRTQKHIYRMKPELSISVSWEDEKGKHHILRKGNQVEKYLNEEKVDADSEALTKSTNAAMYTLFMPWKLLDEGVELNYKGVVELPNEKEAHTISAVYDPESKSNHSTKDDWEYYFDKDTYEYVACMVDHHDYFAFIQNDKKSKSNGLTFNALRNSFRVDKGRNILWKRGEFYYENIVLK